MTARWVIEVVAQCRTTLRPSNAPAPAPAVEGARARSRGVVGPMRHSEVRGSQARKAALYGHQMPHGRAAWLVARLLAPPGKAVESGPRRVGRTGRVRPRLCAYRTWATAGGHN